MEPTDSAAILAEIERAASEFGIRPSTLCLYAVGNGRLPVRLAAGEGLMVSTLERLRVWIVAKRHSEAMHANARKVLLAALAREMSPKRGRETP